MLSDTTIELKNVWKKYSIRDVFHKSLREEFANLFKKGDRQGLRKDEFWALSDVNITVKKGECVGICGPNGSGKTTIIKLIASVTYPNRGEVIVKGRVAPLISVSAGFHSDLTGRENIYMNGTIIGMTIREIRKKIDDIIEFSGIEERFIDMPVKKYSSGMNARLGFSIAVHSEADILLLDEIFAVGDKSFKEKCTQKIKEIKEKRTLVVVSHDRDRIERIADRIIFLRKGRIENEYDIRSNSYKFLLTSSSPWLEDEPGDSRLKRDRGI
ncbi:MAG TPA: ABC transporter ATP-binding protein [Thermodesulfobacteriota bacterium]|nr:ABC transporter ATP-binding protein [Thermodesulfobacteriota bacterium]